MNDLPPIDFVLTPQERDTAVLAALFLEKRRRGMNAEDEARFLRELSVFDKQDAGRD